MISTYALKSSFQNLLRPLSRKLRRANVTPNQVTLFTVLLSLAFGICLVVFRQVPIAFLAVPPFLLLRMALNAIDGMMAREANLESPQGVYLNELGDVVSDLAIFFAFCATGMVRLESMIIFCCLAMLAEMAGLIGAQIGARRAFDGPMGKSDRAVLASVLAVVYVCGSQNVIVFDAILGFGSLALVLTINNRIRSAITSLSNTGIEKVNSK